METRACSYSDVSSLDHEVGNDAVEDGVLVAKIFSSLSFALLAGAQAAEVLSGLRNNIVEKLAITDSSR